LRVPLAPDTFRFDHHGLLFHMEEAAKAVLDGNRDEVMPRVPDMMLDCSIYLYPSRSDAETGEQYGGSGFLVGVRSKNMMLPHLEHTYAVTNRHVVEWGSSPVIRLNTASGGKDVLDLTDFPHISPTFRTSPAEYPRITLTMRDQPL
jgi:hypothetical protein